MPFTKQQLMSTLQEDRVWEDLYGSVDVAGKRAQSSLLYDYSQDIAKAYEASYQNKLNIEASNLGQGFKQRELMENQAALDEAFEQYRQNYLTNVSNVQSNIDESVAGITGELETQAEFTEKTLNSAYDYLNYLYENYNESELFTNKHYFNKYLTDGQLMSRDDLENMMFDLDPVTGIRTQNVKLTDFYDQIFNIVSGARAKEYTSYTDWLRETDEELLNWLQTNNPYSNTTDAYGKSTQYSSIKKLVGLEANDNVYKFAERFGGMSKEDVDRDLEKFVNYSNSLTTVNRENISDISTTIQNYSNELISIMDQYGLSNDLSEAGIDVKELTNIMTKAVEESKKADTVDTPEVKKNWFKAAGDWFGSALKTLGKTGKLLITGRKDYTFKDYGKDIKDIWTDYPTVTSDTEFAVEMYKKLVQTAATLAQAKREASQK